MSFAEQAIKAFADNATVNMHTAYPAKVIAFNEGVGTATVQPLFKESEEVSYPQSQDLPVAKWRYRIMQNKHITEQGQPHNHTVTDGASTTGNEANHKHVIEFEEIIEEIQLLLYPGDVVMCVCCERSIDSISSKQSHVPQSERKFDMSDAVITNIIYFA